MNISGGELPRLRTLDRLLLGATLAMTYLTIAKELVLYQNSSSLIPILIYKLAMRAYYPLLLINLIGLAWAVSSHWKKHRWFPRGLRVACVVFGLNVILFSANNLLNWLEGKPIHRRHQGIGW